MRENKSNKKKLILIAIVFVLLLGTFWGFWLSKTIKAKNSTDATKEEFVIQSGEGAGEIAEKLEEKKFVKSSFAFIFYLNLKRASNKLMAGEYEIAHNLTIPQVVEILTKGKVSTGKVTIPEGWDNERIGKYLEEKGIGTKTEFLANAKADKYRDKYAFLKGVPQGGSLEGYLYPDTYQVSKKPTQDEVITKMLENFDKKYQGIKSTVPENKVSFHELVTLASIIEREVAKPEDRKMVASVFWNRLEIGMPLESCATIQYILKENKKQFTYEETRTPSDYNTYQNKGLPPGPIGNPSIDSINAAIAPNDSDYLYFLSSKGVTYFSKTLEEHNAKKAKYLD